MNTKRYQLDYDLWQLFLNVLGEELVENEISFKEIVRADELSSQLNLKTKEELI